MRGLILTAMTMLVRGAGLAYAARRLRRAVASSLMLAGAACVLLVIMACLVTALWIYAIPRVGPAGAPLVVAGCLLPLALGLLIAARLLGRPPRADTGEHAGPPPAGGGAGFAALASVAVASFLAGLMRGNRHE